MKEWLISVSESVIVAIYALALLVVVIATVEVAIAAVRAAVLRESNHFLRVAWLRYARWLVAALTFQLAADIIETSIGTNWQTIANVGAIALIRTFLNYFLDRDVDAVRTRDHERSVTVERTSS
jgi:uncharacterized membrane protein